MTASTGPSILRRNSFMGKSLQSIAMSKKEEEEKKQTIEQYPMLKR